MSRIGARTPLSTAVAGGALLVPLAVAGFVLRGGILFRRPLWLDEWHTYLIARQETLGDVSAALFRGADFNPPLLFVWQWIVARVAGGASPAQLRLTAFLAVWMAIVLLFVLLRGAFGTGPALAGALLVASMGDVIKHAFEGRFYGPWLLFVVLYAASLIRATETPRSLMRQGAACGCAVLLCTIHYFGIITLGLVAVGVALARYPARNQIVSILPSLAAGLVADIALLPLLHAQRGALSVATWIWPPTPFSVALFAGPSLLMLMIAGALVLPALRPDSRAGSRLAEQRVVAYPFLALALLPVLLVILSFTVQSVIVPHRYTLPSLLALGPIAAVLFTRLGRPARVAFGSIILVLVLVDGLQESQVAAEFDRRVRSDSVELRRVVDRGGALAVASPTVLYPLLGSIPASGPGVGMAIAPATSLRLRFPAGSDSAAIGNAYLVVQDVARVHSSVFGVPRLFPLDSLARLPCFYVLELGDEAQFVQRWMPDMEAVRVSPHLFMVRRRDSPAAC